jgi:hypothetical protein
VRARRACLPAASPSRNSEQIRLTQRCLQDDPGRYYIGCKEDPECDRSHDRDRPRASVSPWVGGDRWRNRLPACTASRRTRCRKVRTGALRVRCAWRASPRGARRMLSPGLFVRRDADSTRRAHEPEPCHGSARSTRAPESRPCRDSGSRTLGSAHSCKRDTRHSHDGRAQAQRRQAASSRRIEDTASCRRRPPLRLTGGIGSVLQ